MDSTNFILSTTASYFQLDKILDDSYVRDFLENDTQRVLSASLNDSRNSIQFQSKIPNEHQNILLFYKTQLKEKKGNLSDLGMLTLEGGIVKSIYNSLTSIFVPSAVNKNEYTAEIMALIENLQTNLSVSLGVAETGITSIKDEIFFWRQKSANSTTRADKDAANMFADQLENLNLAIGEFSNAKSAQKLNILEDLMDRVQYILDELWRIKNFQYPQNRMISVIDVLSNMIVSCCVDEMNQQDDIWSSSSMNLNELISHVMDIVNNWNQTCDSLTRLFWTNCDTHPWIGKPYIPVLMTRFKARIEDIMDIKQIHRQISSLSSEDESIDLKSRDYFHSFRDINIFDTTPLGDKYWGTAKGKFEQSLSNIDERIAAIIKFSIQNALNNPRQVIYIFSKYENILKRQKIKAALRIECDHLYQSVLLFVKQLSQELNEKKNHLEDDDDEISPLVCEIKWLKIIEYQVQQIIQICQSVLYDRENYNELSEKLKEFQEELEQNLKLNYDQWCEQSQSSVISGELVLKDNEPVVKFEKAERQLMTVTYNPKLMIFCHDIRHLKNFGFHQIPADLIKYGAIGRKYVKYARNLQQIANFHNTIGDRIIPCQRPIMLKNALELSNLVKSQSVSWNNEESVKKYIMVLQGAINQLSRDNNLLSGYHEIFKKSILKLMNTDLLKQSNIWKEELKSLRDAIATLERKGYTNLHLFKLHWDYQLYKALEHQLIVFLIDSKEKLHDIHIDLVFRDQKLQFRPTLEEIRFEYYSQIRKYVEMPLHFHGFSDNSNQLFRVMIERNRPRFKRLYDRAEKNFQRLCEFKDLWLPWVSLGCVNLESLCQIHLSTWQNWDQNFKSCKNFSQKIAKIQKSEERIDCFVVNVTPVRSHIEFIARSFWETLSVSLRSSILEDNSVLHEYITTALNVLQHIPSDDDNGIISASFKYEKIVQDLPRMTELLKNVQDKNICLSGWCKETVGSLDSLIVQWEKLLPLIENHQVLLKGQLEVIKENIQSKIKMLNSDAEKFLIKWEDTLKDMEASNDVDFEAFKERKVQWIEFTQRRDVLLNECDKFNATFSKELNENFKKVENEIKKLGDQWTIFEDFLSDFESIEHEEWSVYRRKPYVFTDFLSKWETKTSNMVTIPAMRIKKQIEKFRSILPILTMLQSDSLSDKHWASLFDLVDVAPKSYHTIVFADILSHSQKFSENSSELKAIVHQAYSEQIVRQAITELEQWAVLANLKLFAHVESRNETIMLVKDFQEPLNKIGDNQCLLQSAKNSITSDSFTDQIELWENKLNILSFILNNLFQIQKKWIYLEPIFANGTLKHGDTSFNRIDKDFRYIMREIGNNPKVMSLVKINNIQMIIESLTNQLHHCQNTLSAYMTGKRELFPRFYFLSDEDLLEILGQASKENIIQKHISKLFPGTHKLELNSDGKYNIIKAIKSAEGDSIQLQNAITTSDAIELWLGKLESEIKSTLKYQIRLCYQRNDVSLETIEKFPMQILCLVNSIYFTSKLEKSIMGMNLAGMLSNLKSDINNFSAMLQSSKSALTKLKIRALLFDFVYHVTTVEYLIKHNVTNLNDWHFLQQLKFYISRTDEISIKVVNAEFEYSYEFLGNYNKLVYTSLTHNCYLTLTQAMYLGLGGNPFGKAGTGKTECVKSLGAMMGRMVLVFNCNENIDTSAMALILTGISRCGAWACFDEFNRLQQETLSAIAMLIQPLQIALKDKQDVVHMMDKKIPLNRHACIFVTLNPADEDYGGRNQLPSNLQALFRPIVMQQPEPKEIAKVMLFIEGFRNAEEIGKRIVELFDLSNKLLSPQRHYDWGLRELKTVLDACGKSLSIYSKENNQEISLENEIKIVVNSLRPNVMSKLTLSDCKRFEMLLKDVFPGMSSTENPNQELYAKIEETFQLLRLTKNDRQIQKCVELYEQLNKRIGVTIFGPPNSGKSTTIAVLKSVLSSMNKTIRTYIISPKSMKRSQLLGYLDVNTRQWHDGILTQTAIAVNSEPQDVISWIICDGDVDPEWIEALNSVLDDNKLLTLPSGWRIQFGNNVNFIFETHDLVNASPATISRMGIVKFNAEDLPPSSILDSWVMQNSNAEMMNLLVEKYFWDILETFHEFNKLCSYLPKTSIIQNILRVISNVESNDEFVVQVVQALNALIDSKERNKFTNMILDKFNVYTSDPNHAEFLYFNKFRNSVDTYLSDDAVTLNMEDQNINTLLHKTASVKSSSDLLRNVLKNSECPPFLICGPNGNGKSLLINSIVSEFTGYQLVTVKCSAQINANQVLYILKQNCLVVSGIRGKEYKPKQSRLILFMKNIDLCPVDNWGTCEVVELLLMLINRSGFFSENLEWIGVTGIQICGTLTNIARQNLSPRFTSKCNILLTSYPNEKDMQNIIMSFLSVVFDKTKNVAVKKEKMCETILDIFNEIKRNFTPDISNHYKFTPKMIQELIVGLTYYPSENFVQGFFYELTKVFGDRLMTMEHELIFNDILKQNAKYFNIIFEPYDNFFIQTSSAKESQLQMIDSANWSEIIEKNLPICSSETAVIDLPVTIELMKTVSSVIRTLTRSGRNMCLAGKLGSGRFESTVIACTILNIKIFYPQVTRNYSFNDFINDLKLAMQTCGLENEVAIFYIDQVWINYYPNILKSCEAILEDSMLGENLFGDDLETIANSLKGAAQLEGYQDNLVSFFLNRVKNNLHLIIALESTTTQFQETLKTYKSLYSKTDFLWLQDICTATKQVLCEKVIKQMKNDSNFSTNLEISSKHFETIISSDCGVWIDSPKRSIQLIKTYNMIHHQFYGKKISSKTKFELGIQKLSDAYKYVATLKDDAKEKEKALAEKRQLANQALEMISMTMKSANDQKTDMIKLKSKTEENGEILKQRKIEIENELSLVEPLLREASAAVGQIKTEALSEIRSLRAPPEAIRDILEGVLRLMGIRDTSWNSMKSFLAKRGVKEDIRSLNPSLISPQNCDEVERLIETKPESFDPRNAKRASAAAAPLASWVLACVKYSKVIQSIKPLEREQMELERNLEKTENEMKSLSSGIDDVNVKVKELSEQLNGYTQEAAVLEIKLEETRKTLKSTEVLVEKLSTEYQNWSQELHEISSEIEDLDKCSIMVALCLTHFSHMLEEERAKYLSQVCESMHMSFNLEQIVYNDQDKLMWESMGLSSDKQSVENAAIITKYLLLPFATAPIPLFHDPTKSAFNWLVSYLKTKSTVKFEVLNQNDDRFTYNLELGVRFGKILIIEDVNQNFTASLLSILTLRVHSRFNKRMLHIGNKFVDLHEDFRLILISFNGIKQLNGDINANLTIIPFTLTASGLTQQLLTKWISLKHPDMEKKRVELLQNEGKLMLEKIHLQEKLLEELSHAEGDILKNEKLLATLNQIKESSFDIEKSLTESHDIRLKLLENYNEYQEICSQSASFYVDIAKIYEFNPDSFVQIFLDVLEKSKEFGDLSNPFAEIVRKTYITLNRSIRRSEQLQLSLNVCKCAFKKKISDVEWEMFIFNFADSADSTVDPNIPKWIKKELVPKVSNIKQQHPALYQKLNLENDYDWRQFIDATENVTKYFPKIEISDFHQLLVYQIFRPDQMLNAINNATSNLLGIKSDTIIQSSIEQLLKEVGNKEPLLIVASGGVDPSRDIKEFSKSKFNEIFVGKGQETTNLNLVATFAQEGGIVCVKNVHLMPQFMQTVDSKLKSLKINENFRLIYVCESEKNISKHLIKKCRILFMEPPNGIKHKVFTLLEQNQAILMQNKDYRHMKLFVALFILHSILQERRNFIPLGWCKWYDFGEADIRAAVDFILAANKKSQNVDWKILKGLLEKIVYGGRVDNDQDFEKLICIIDEYFDAKVMNGKWTPKFFNISIPNANSIEEYQHSLMKIEGNNLKPKMFGLSSTSSVARSITICRNLLKDLRKIYFNIDDSENYEKRIRPLMIMWKKFKNSTDLTALLKVKNDTITEDLNPWSLFKISEIILASELSSKITETFTKMSSFDLNMISDSDRNVMLTLSDNSVPYEWRKLWPGSKVASEFLKSVTTRIQTSLKFIENVDKEIDEIDFGKIFNVDSFLSTVKLVASRDMQISTSKLILKSLIDEKYSPQLKNKGVKVIKVQPLLIDGLGFENNKLVASDGLNAKNMTGNICIYYEESNNDEILPNAYQVPLYSNSSRERLLCTINMNTTALERSDIIYSGTALIVPIN